MKGEEATILLRQLQQVVRANLKQALEEARERDLLRTTTEKGWATLMAETENEITFQMAGVLAGPKSGD